MAASSQFKLISTATAIAIIAPENLCPEINSLRKLHDKAFRKWQPHINLLYPFVEPSQLPAAVSILRQHLLDRQNEKLQVNLNQVDSFTHRRNATVFLKPSSESESVICQLRGSLANSLGCDDSEGTHDGTFRPHMTIGQAALTGTQLERLTEKVGSLAGVAWDARSLVVLKREPTGEMKIVEELHLGVVPDEKIASHNSRLVYDGYSNCFSFDYGTGWAETRIEPSRPEQMRRDSFEVSLATYNLMAEVTAPSFSSRLDLIIQSIRSVVEFTQTQVRVLCLQEVNTEILPLLLSNPFIQQTYPYASHMPSSRLPSHRNLMTLCSERFRYSKVDFEERHKSMLDISLVDYPVRVINVHLSSALTDESVTIKMRQMEKVTKFAATSNLSDSREVIVAGDFNLTTSARTIQTAMSRRIIKAETAQLVHKVIDSNIWDDAFIVCNLNSLTNEDLVEGEKGSTFDRSSNPLAAISEPPIDRSPQRYDRVLYRKGGLVNARETDIFGLPNESGDVGSDHYGVCVTLRVGKSSHVATSSDQTSQIDIIEDSTDLNSLIQSFLPTPIDRKQRTDALALLHETISKDSNLKDLILAPLGSYLMDTYFADSDVDVLAIGSVPPKVFFDFASTRLQELAVQQEDGNNFKGVHFVNSLVSIIELVVLGIKFDVQYCQAPELIERYHKTKPAPNLAIFVFDSALVSRLSPSSVRPLNTYRDTAYLLNTVSDLSSYRLAHRFLSLFLKRRGLYSAKFGYLGGIHLSLMLNRVVKLIASTSASNSVPVSPATTIRTFLTYYANFDWARDIITDPEIDMKPMRAVREAVFIHAIHTPTARPNVASSCTRLSSQIFTSDFALASKHLEKGDWEWCLRSKNDVIAEFMSNFGAFVRISIDIWDIDEIGSDKVRGVVGGLESKMTRLLVGLGRHSGIDARIWPARFRSPLSPLGPNLGDNLQGLYLVGISAHEDDVERKRLLTSKIIAVVREFESSVKDSREMSALQDHVWCNMEVVPRKKIIEQGLILDERDWGAVGEKATLQAHSDSMDLDESTISLALPNHPKSHCRKSSNSLRPAQDIIARIKWDASLSISDFLIGYEDRFVGVKEMDLGKWKSECTDEEFIPMHRVVWVRRKDVEGEGSGIKVWDRRKKVDLLFGSGVGSG